MAVISTDFSAEGALQRSRGRETAEILVPGCTVQRGCKLQRSRGRETAEIRAALVPIPRAALLQRSRGRETAEMA